MECTKIPSSLAKKAIRRTKETGNEHAFVICGDGETSDLLEGDDRSVDIEVDCNSGDRVAIFHTHPNGTLRLSPPDREVLAHENVDSVCVAVPDGRMVCERSKPSCTGRFDV